MLKEQFVISHRLEVAHVHLDSYIKACEMLNYQTDLVNVNFYLALSRVLSSLVVNCGTNSRAEF